MARLSRDESRVRTRARLLDAAEKVFAAKGLSVSLEEIADAAGYTRGAVYYHFADKEDMFVAVLEERNRLEVLEISGLIENSDDPTDFIGLLRLRGERRRQNKDSQRWGLLSAEFWLYALRNPRARVKLAEHHRNLREEYAGAAAAIFSQLGIESPAPLERIATVLFALDQGIFHQHWIDPEAVPDDAYYETLELLLSAVVALDEKRRTALLGTKE